MRFGLYFNNGKVALIDMATGEILTEDRYEIWMWFNAYENNYTLTLIQGLTKPPINGIIKKKR